MILIVKNIFIPVSITIRLDVFIMNTNHIIVPCFNGHKEKTRSADLSDEKNQDKNNQYNKTGSP